MEDGDEDTDAEGDGLLDGELDTDAEGDVDGLLEADVDGDDDADGLLEAVGEGDAEVLFDGLLERDDDGDGLLDGLVDGEAEGVADALAEGDEDRDADGDVDGDAEADADGVAEADWEGLLDLDAEGEVEGELDVEADGDDDFEDDGDRDGDVDGVADTEADGEVEGEDDTEADGEVDGEPDGLLDGETTPPGTRPSSPPRHDPETAMSTVRVEHHAFKGPLVRGLQPQTTPDSPHSRIDHDRPSGLPVPALLHQARIAGAAAEGLDGRLRVIGRFFRRVTGENAPVHPPAAGRQAGVQIYHPAVESFGSQADWAKDDVRCNRGAVVVVSSDLADVAVRTSQKQLSFVLTDHAGRVIVLHPHRPERLRDRLVNPMRVTSACGSEVNVKRLSILLPPKRYGCGHEIHVSQFIGNCAG